jgi:hypothetical protein
VYSHVAGVAGMHGGHAQLLLVEMGSWELFAQAGLPISASWVARIIG